MALASSPLKQNIKDDGVKREKLSGRGNGLLATRDFSPHAQILFVKRPLILALDKPQLETTCYACLRSQDAQVTSNGTEPGELTLKTCMGCHTVRFCNKTCQKHAWTSYHKLECKLFAELHPRVLPSAARGIIRLLLQLKHGLITDEEWSQLRDLESHQNDLCEAGGDRWEDIALMIKAIMAYSGTKESLETVTRICCTLMVNSFTLTTPTFDPVGIVLHPLPAMMNHSCEPNAIVRFDITSSTSPVPIPKVHHGSISVHALRPIAKGEEICITYIDATMSLERRQADLKLRYFFDCGCLMCQRGPRIEESNAEALPTLSTATNLLLSLSSKPRTHELYIPELRRALGNLAALDDLPLHSYPYAQLRHQLVLALIATQDFEEAMRQNLVLTSKIDPVLYEQQHHPSRLVSKWRLLQLVKYCAADTSSEATAETLSILTCVLLDGLANTCLKNAAGSNVTEVTDEKPDVPLGQFELMVYQALVEVKHGDGKVIWQNYEARKSYWRAETAAWAEGIMARVLKDEPGGGLGGGQLDLMQ